MKGSGGIDDGLEIIRTYIRERQFCNTHYSSESSLLSRIYLYHDPPTMYCTAVVVNPCPSLKKKCPVTQQRTPRTSKERRYKHGVLHGCVQ